MRGAWIGLVAAVATSLAASPTAAAGDRFDGQWSVGMTCANSGATTAYSWKFDASIQNSALHPEHGSPGQPGYRTMDGTLKDDGSAALTGTV